MTSYGGATARDAPEDAEFPHRSPAEQHMVLRQFLFSLTPGRRVPPVARSEPVPAASDDPPKSVVDAKPTTSPAAADGESNKIRHRVTTTHAQELLTQSRSLRGDTGDRPANRPLEVGTLPDRCRELLHYYERCQNAAERERLVFLSSDDGGVVAPRVSATGLVRGVKKKLQAASRTYSTERTDYVSLAAFTEALEEEDRRAGSIVNLQEQEAKQRAAEELSRRARRSHLASKRGPPVLRSALRASAQSMMLAAAGGGAGGGGSHGAVGVTHDDAVHAGGAIVLDMSKKPRLAERRGLPAPRPLDHGTSRSRPPTAQGLSLSGTSPTRPVTRGEAPRSAAAAAAGGSPGTSPKKRSRAQQRARGEVVTGGVSSLGAAVLNAENDTIENYRCEPYAERFPSPAASPMGMLALEESATLGKQSSLSPSNASLTAVSSCRRLRLPTTAPPVDVRGQREFSKRTCKHDARRPRSFGEILRERFIGDASALVESSGGEANDESAGENSTSAAAAALRARLPPTRSVYSEALQPPTLQAALARTDLTPAKKARAALESVVAAGRRAATPSISKPRAALGAERNTSSRSMDRRKAASTPDLSVRRIGTPSANSHRAASAGVLS